MEKLELSVALFASSQESKLGEFSSLLSFLIHQLEERFKEKIEECDEVGVKVSGPCGVYRT